MKEFLPKYFLTLISHKGRPQVQTTSVAMHVALDVLCGSPRGESLVKATGMLIILPRGRNCLFSNEHVYYFLIK